MAQQERRANTGALAALKSFVERYRWLGWVAFVFFVALGFDFKTPAKHFQELEAEVHTVAVDRLKGDSTLGASIAKGDSLRNELRDYVKALMIGECLDRPRSETVRMGLPCRRLEAEPVLQVRP